MVPVTQNYCVFGIIRMDLLRRVNNKRSAETINILSLFGIVQPSGRVRKGDNCIPMHVHEPNMSPTDLMNL